MTKTEICNRALAVLGHDRKVTDFDGKTGSAYNDTSTEAERCRQFFDSALGDCLSEHDWDFAAVEIRVGLAHPDAFGWARFSVPEDCIRLVSAHTDDGSPLPVRRTRDFAEIRTDGQYATVRYVSSDVDTSTLPHRFREAFIYRLASLLCAPMFGSDQKADGYSILATRKLSEAMTRETDETAYRGAAENPFVTARR